MCKRRSAILSHRRVKYLIARAEAQGPWRLWFELVNGRPSITGRFCMAADIGYGVGSSNSVLSVGHSDTGQKLAEFVHAGVSPEELARLAVAFCYWLSPRTFRA
jgi:hypothetical protein